MKKILFCIFFLVCGRMLEISVRAQCSRTHISFYFKCPLCEALIQYFKYTKILSCIFVKSGYLYVTNAEKYFRQTWVHNTSWNKSDITSRPVMAGVIITKPEAVVRSHIFELRNNQIWIDVIEKKHSELL